MNDSCLWRCWLALVNSRTSAQPIVCIAHDIAELLSSRNCTDNNATSQPHRDNTATSQPRRDIATSQPHRDNTATSQPLWNKYSRSLNSVSKTQKNCTRERGVSAWRALLWLLQRLCTRERETCRPRELCSFCCRDTVPESEACRPTELCSCCCWDSVLESERRVGLESFALAVAETLY